MSGNDYFCEIVSFILLPGALFCVFWIFSIIYVKFSIIVPIFMQIIDPFLFLNWCNVDCL